MKNENTRGEGLLYRRHGEDREYSPGCVQLHSHIHYDRYNNGCFCGLKKDEHLQGGVIQSEQEEAAN